MSSGYEHAFAAMGTVVTIQIVGHGADASAQDDRKAAVARAAGWFHHINDECTRFDAASELMRLSSRVGQPVHVSALLFEVVRFALAVAEESGGAFDPTVGVQMAARGYDREYRSGDVVRTTVGSHDAGADAGNYRDVHLDVDTRTITLDRPMVLDLGAVAKGLAVDMAARELQPYENFGIDAGGDLYLGGRNADGKEWSVGIRNPRDPNMLLRTISVSNAAVCTSGDYERGRHIIDPRTGEPATSLASVTVTAPSAMVADALATAAFVLGPIHGVAFLERQRVDGLLVTPNLEQYPTRGMHRAS